MAAMSRGPLARSRSAKNTKGGTPSSRRHRFESFSQRIAKLKIEPVRRGRSTYIDDEELDSAFSYFKNALGEWGDLNISEAFTSFARRVAPLCESLPQILHHHGRIHDLLMEYIERGDKWSEEPLLSLVTHLAHDLGQGFEIHFERTVKTVSHLAATHQEAEVIEWSFSCLAWLFKYLSRHLVSDLRPVFDLVAPLLGHAHQKYFVNAFAAQSMSFLVRKAAAAYHRNEEPLRLIITHISESLKAVQGNAADQGFQQGLMALFMDSMQGVQRGLHSSADAVLQELLIQAYHEDYSSLSTSPLEAVITGTLTALIHASDADGFRSLVDTLLAHIQSSLANTRSIGLSARLLYTVCGVRKGSRIKEWKPVLELVGVLINAVDSSSQVPHSDRRNVITATAVTFQYCTLDAAIPYAQQFEVLSEGPWEPHFVLFSIFFADLGSERFQTFLLPVLKRFIIQKASEHSRELCIALPLLHTNHAIPKDTIQTSSRWHSDVTRQFTMLANLGGVGEDLDSLVPQCHAYLQAVDVMGLPPEVEESICESLFKALEMTLQNEVLDKTRPNHILACGRGFMFLVEHFKSHDRLLKLWPSICRASTAFARYLLFWQAIHVFLAQTRGQVELDDPSVGIFKQSLMQCLSSPSHDMRLAALGILEIIKEHDEAPHNAVSIASLIEQTPISLENARSISMRIRELAKSYPSICTDEWTGEAIPTYCFGLLHMKLGQAWDDSIVTLKEMCMTKEGQSYVSRLAIQWLDPSDFSASTTTGAPDVAAAPRRETQYQCTNVMQLDQKLIKVVRAASDIDEQLKEMFDSTHEGYAMAPLFCRSQALRVLNAIPNVAEKHSQSLVPVLLNWVLKQSDEDGLEELSLTLGEHGIVWTRWSKQDKKALLSLFSKFVNPKALYKSSEVYEALLVLLCHGDAEIQNAALTAILSWKDSAITRYKENLFNLLDNARFREEISVFMDVGKEESQIQEEHRRRLMPVILRLLYGKVVSGRRGLEAKRKAVFIALTRFEQDDIHQFLGIALGPLAGISVLGPETGNEVLLQKELLSPRKQVGLLNMLDDILQTLQTTITPFTNDIVDPILYCLLRASLILGQSVSSDIAESDPVSQLSLWRTIRQRGYHSLNVLFENCPQFQWDRYIPLIIQELVNPRLENFPIETAHSISGLLRLFATWSKSVLTAPYLAQYNRNILVKIIDCLEIPSAKDEVRLYVLNNVLRSLSSLVSDTGEPSTETTLARNRIHSEIIQPYSTTILSRIGSLLRKSPSKDLLEASVHTVAEWAPYIVGSAESRSITEIATFLLPQPLKRVNIPTKLGLLRILHEFISRCNQDDIKELFDVILDAVCPLFAIFQDRQSRDLLCDILQDLSETIGELQTISQLGRELNSFSLTKLDEPDFDRRSQAFGSITDKQDCTFSLVQWKPLVYNMLFYIKDNDELSTRVNASLALRRFVDASTLDESLRDIIQTAVLPGIQNGMREASELVRVEFVTLLSHLVTVYPDWPPIAGLSVLLSSDEESSFFSNVLHIQGHRRLRAVRRLASNVAHLRSSTVYHILIPLLEHFVFNKGGDEGAHNLAGEAIKAVCSLCECLEWPQFKSLLKRVTGYLTSKEDQQKTIVKLLAGMLDSLNRAGRSKGYVTALSKNEDGENSTQVSIKPLTLAATLPAQAKLSNDLNTNILPPLTEFLHNKDETTVSLRVPVAVAVTKVLLVLPPNEIRSRLPPVLMDICYILRSKSQDGRDLARNTLAEIAKVLGFKYLGFILESLRTALKRGSQLHVLSFTLHHILVQMSPELEPGDLDYCLDDIVAIIIDDIFGVTGKEKDTEEYVSKMKEVKSSKSFDSMDIIARSTTSTHLVQLVFPIKDLLQMKRNAKEVNKIDELLRRIGLGIIQNQTLKDRDILVFCYELTQQVYNANTKYEDTTKEVARNEKYLINIKGALKSGERSISSTFMYKLARFSLDIVRTVMRKHAELLTAQNVVGFLPIIGDAMVQGQEELQISAIRLLSTVIKVPLAALDNDCLVYVTEAVRMVRDSPSTNGELAQASIKLVSAILRERPNVMIKERDLAFLLKRLLPDLDEPDRQGVTFTFIKAIMYRKIVITELYEVMDKVAAMMVTNQSRSARDLARSNYFHFLMEYPQARNRLKKQLEFLVRNLRYDYVEGRQSVMEALNLILSKVGDDVLQDALGMMFLPLVHAMANDDSNVCRTMAGELLKKVFERADTARVKGFTSDLRIWLEQDEDAGLKRLSIQCWGLYLEVAGTKAKDVAYVTGHLRSTMGECLERRGEDDWELIFYSLAVLFKLCKASPDATLSRAQADLWDSIQSCVSYPHTWVKLTAAKLMGVYFADFASTNGDTALGTLPLEGSRGLQLSGEVMVRLANAFLKNLSIPSVSEDLCSQSVRNLAFLSRCFAVNGAEWDWRKVDDDDEVEDESREDIQGTDGDVAPSDEEWHGFSPEPAEPVAKATSKIPTAMHRVILRLSGIIRRETKIMVPSALYPKTATMNLVHSVASKLPMASLTTSLPHVLTTLTTLTDPLTTVPRSSREEFNDAYKALTDKAREVLDMLQKRMGTHDYVKAMAEVNKGVRERREERRGKRRVEAVAQPERAGREKRRRNEVKKARRKERREENRGKRRGW
ncbi:HEAT repeat protein-like protein [Polyplosphaeria fusca]|uniref:HEAT repeat protein-like protein n=1 Tax=Polyplosphaeria fusca TaxID=682080 RepID=A0A9P4QQE7_9PLEO|nr:HEAT repeat protein-like protein [Polyplosphaeria fusca]